MQVKPECGKCHCDNSELWNKSEEFGVLCHVCHSLLEKDNGNETNKRSEEISSQGDEGSVKSTASDKSIKFRKNGKLGNKSVKKANSVGKNTIQKGKSRRNVFKKHVFKSPPAVVSPMTSTSVYYKDTYYQLGDIVSLIDVGGGTYYAQIRGLMTDQYCEKSAVISWLLPTQDSPPPDEGFDPTTYLLGPDEEVPRKLECMEFICHAPSDYYKAHNAPYPMPAAGNIFSQGYIWTRIGPDM